jgi:hypothetical protein
MLRSSWFATQDSKPPCWKIRILRQDCGPSHTMVKSVNLQSLDILVSFVVVSLFTNVPVDEAP